MKTVSKGVLLCQPTKSKEPKKQHKSFVVPDKKKKISGQEAQRME